MTLNEYITADGVIPSATLNLVPSLGTVKFEDLFKANFGDRECIYDDETLFSAKLNLYATIICNHAKAKIETLGAFMDNITNPEQVEVMEAKAAPLGVMSGSAASLGGTVRSLTGANTLRIGDVIDYQDKLQNMYWSVLREFEPLFQGVF